MCPPNGHWWPCFYGYGNNWRLLLLLLLLLLLTLDLLQLAIIAKSGLSQEKLVAKSALLVAMQPSQSQTLAKHCCFGCQRVLQFSLQCCSCRGW